MDKLRRKVIGAGGAGLLASSLPTGMAFAQGSPVKIGMSMPQTGGLGAGGQAALIGLRMWVDDINAKGGLLGRKVDLTAYDDQSNGALTPGIYTKLLDVDKVDLLIAPYATNVTAPIMPLVKERKKLLMGNFSFQVNAKPQHDMWFNNAPWNDARGWSVGFFDMGKKAGAKTAAIIAADGEFQQNLANGAREVVKQAGGLNIVFDQNYPPNSTDFSSIIRAIRASKAEVTSQILLGSPPVALLNELNAHTPDLHHAQAVVRGDDERPEQRIVAAQEREERHRDDHGPHQRCGDGHEEAEVPAPVHARGVKVVLRQLAQRLPEEKDCERARQEGHDQRGRRVLPGAHVGFGACFGRSGALRLR